MSEATMKAVICPRYGPPDVLQLTTIERPVVKDNEILIKIHATSVTAAHCAMRAGKPYFGRLFIGLAKPKMKIPGTDLSGEVIEKGTAVTRFNVGDQVMAASDLRGSCYAEYISLPENYAIVPKPVNMNHTEASSILDGGTTALVFLRDVGKLRQGQHILINGASGGIGTFAVQLARHFGASVTGVCSAVNVGLVKSLGADEVLDYTKDDFTLNGKEYDIIFDTVGKLSFGKCRRSIRKGGVYMTPVLKGSVLFQMMATGMLGSRKVKFAATGLRKAEEKIRDLNFLKELIEKGKLRTVIDRQYKLEQVTEAQQYVETGRKKGSVVINMAGH